MQFSYCPQHHLEVLREHGYNFVLQTVAHFKNLGYLPTYKGLYGLFLDMEEKQHRFVLMNRNAIFFPFKSMHCIFLY